MSIAATQVMQTSSAQTSSGNSALVFATTIDRSAQTLSVLVNVTAVSGTTPSIVVSVQWSNDKVTWFDSEVPDSFTAITTTKKVAKAFAIKAAFARLTWVITGTTPSVTFDASGYAA